ncbi:MAG: hypothetical protein JNM96_06720, partial [Bacteroidia bacterium]|nr:hypothetical protein [Bacteroidia bacterium]
GEKLKTIQVNKNYSNIDISEFSAGVYVFQIGIKSSEKNYNVVKKVMKN